MNNDYNPNYDIYKDMEPAKPKRRLSVVFWLLLAAAIDSLSLIAIVAYLMVLK